MKIRQRLEALHRHPSFSSAERVRRHLVSQGFETLFAGGCVRDGWRETRAKDLDLATAARPEEIERAFERTLDVGKAFGTIRVIEDGEAFEVTTFRSEGGYSDGRRPTEVRFTTAREDALRRDFTVNALFYDADAETTIDYVGGVDDLHARRLRTVGEAEARFTEDHLRMLRAVRFVAQLGFQLEPEVHAAIARLHTQLGRISVERVLAELQGLLKSKHIIAGLDILQSTKLYQECLPEMETLRPAELHAFPVFTHWESALAAVYSLCDQAAALVPRLRALKAANESVRWVQDVVTGANTLMSPETARGYRLLALGSPLGGDALGLATGLLARTGRVTDLLAIREDYLRIARPDGSLPEPFLSGADLITLGVPKGPEFGRILKRAFAAQLEGEIATREAALAFVRQELKV